MIIRPSLAASRAQSATKANMARYSEQLWGYNMISKATRYLYSLKADRSAPRRRSNTPSLPANIQDHLGRMLRAEYYERGDKPRFLGDPALPLEFDPYLQRLDRNERDRRSSMIGEKGRHAVAAALLGLNA
jgi:hypothetical protein